MTGTGLEDTLLGDHGILAGNFPATSRVWNRSDMQLGNSCGSCMMVCLVLHRGCKVAPLGIVCENGSRK